MGGKSGKSWKIQIFKIQWTFFRSAWLQEILWNYKADNYFELVENMLSSFHQLCNKMSIKVHYIHSYLDDFPENLDNLIEKQGKWFHQN